MDEKKCSEYITTTVLVSFSLSFLAFIFICIFAFFLRNIIFLFFGLVLFATTVSAVSLQICRGLGDNFSYALGSSITAIGQVLCNVLFLVIFRLGVTGMILATIIGNLLCGIITFYRCDLRKYIIFNNFSKKAFKELSAYSLPLIPNQLSWWGFECIK